MYVCKEASAARSACRDALSLSRLYMRTCRLVPPFCGAKAKTNQVKEEEKEVSRQSNGNITCRQADR